MSQTQTTNNEDPDKLLNDWLGELDNLIGVSQDKSPEKASNFHQPERLELSSENKNSLNSEFSTLNFQANLKFVYFSTRQTFNDDESRVNTTLHFSHKSGKKENGKWKSFQNVFHFLLISTLFGWRRPPQ